MAYVSQELKSKLAPAIKAACKKYGVKASIAVRDRMTLVLNIKSGQIDFIGDYQKGESQFVKERPITYIDVNEYHYRNHFSGRARDFLEEVLTAMNAGNHDNSDIMTDYFDVGWYTDVKIGQWNKPYVLEA
jgi:hypothetical protein